MYDVVVRMMAYPGTRKCRRWRNRRLEAVDSSRAIYQSKTLPIVSLLKPPRERARVRGLAMRCTRASGVPRGEERTRLGTYMCKSTMKRRRGRRSEWACGRVDYLTGV